MTCSSEIEKNPACVACELKHIIRQGSLASNYLEKREIPQGIQITTKPKDAMVGIPKRQVVYCARELGIPVEEEPSEPEFIKELRKIGYSFGKVDRCWKPKGRNVI